MSYDVFPGADSVQTRSKRAALVPFVDKSATSQGGGLALVLERRPSVRPGTNARVSNVVSHDGGLTLPLTAQTKY